MTQRWPLVISHRLVIVPVPYGQDSLKLAYCSAMTSNAPTVSFLPEPNAGVGLR